MRHTSEKYPFCIRLFTQAPLTSCMPCGVPCTTAYLPDGPHPSGKASVGQLRGASHVGVWAGAGEPDGNLVRVLRRYAGKLPWSASIFQPAVSQAPALLLVLLEAHVQDGEAQGKAGDSCGSISAAPEVP